MYRISLTGLALITVAACAPQETSQTINSSDFAVASGEVNIGALMIQCFDAPMSGSFPICVENADKL